MGRSPGFGSSAGDEGALITLAFAVAPAETALARHPPILAGSYSKRQAVRRRTSFHGMTAHGFRVYFTPLAGVLFTVPSRYYTLSVSPGTSPWGNGRPGFQQDITCPVVLEVRPNGRQRVGYGAITRCGAVFQTALPALSRSKCREPALRGRLATPEPQRLVA
jgi:hypothetical protein